MTSRRVVRMIREAGRTSSGPIGRSKRFATNQTNLLVWGGGATALMATEPLYSIVATRAEELIASGEWQAGERLPPERRLCREFDVSRSTLRQALAELEERGLITRRQGRGTFVSHPWVQLPIAGVFSIRAAMEARGIVMKTRVIGVEIVEASRQMASDLGCLPGDPVVHIERLRSADGEPMVLDGAHLRAESFPGLEDADLERRSLYDILRDDHGCMVAAATETLEPVILTPREGQLLGVGHPTPALLTRRVTTDTSGATVAIEQALLRGDRSRYLYTRTVDAPAAQGPVGGPRVGGGARVPGPTADGVEGS